MRPVLFCESIMHHLLQINTSHKLCTQYCMPIHISRRFRWVDYGTAFDL